jgi:hypothetical protein
VLQCDVDYEVVASPAAAQATLDHLQAAVRSMAVTDDPGTGAGAGAQTGCPPCQAPEWWAQQVFVGMDCEWGEGDTPALIQVSVHGRVFLIDTLHSLPKAYVAAGRGAVRGAEGVGTGRGGILEEEEEFSHTYVKILREVLLLIFSHEKITVVGKGGGRWGEGEEERGAEIGEEGLLIVLLEIITGVGKRRGGVEEEGEERKRERERRAHTHVRTHTLSHTHTHSLSQDSPSRETSRS